MYTRDIIDIELIRAERNTWNTIARVHTRTAIMLNLARKNDPEAGFLGAVNCGLFSAQF